jgi:5-methylcytosine-specific restriction enzyme subunit McrC
VLGGRLASNKEWWGTEEATEKSVISCSQSADGRWTITVNNAVGVIAVGDVQIMVAPKIPEKHFLYLAEKSKQFPRVDEQKILMCQSKSLAEVVGLWFVEAAEKLLRGELTKGYSEIDDILEVVRGRMHIVETAQAFYRGSRTIFCEFDDFNADIAINRVLRGAAEIVASAPLYDAALRRRAKAILSRMEDVGYLQHNDLRCQIDRLVYRYRDAIAFAKYILTSCGVQISHGLKHGWAFLIRTPDIIEAGLREVLTAKLQADWKIEKRGIQLEKSRLTLTPDLVFDRGKVVGDIKYKIADSEWLRTDLYQIVTFSAGYRTQLGLIIGFTRDAKSLPPMVKVGDILIKYFGWDARDESNPSDSSDALASALHDWLSKGIASEGLVKIA